MKYKKKRKKITLFDVVVHIISGFLLLIVIYPLIVVLSSSISEPGLVATGKVILLPKGINWEGYKAVFADKDIMTGYANTFFYTVFGTIINLLVTVPAGYALTKKAVPGRNFVMTLFMITMYFGGGMIPSFLLVKSLGLYNTRWVLLILGAFSTYNCIICRSFFAAMPQELEEAASIDGSGFWRTLFQIVFPVFVIGCGDVKLHHILAGEEAVEVDEILRFAGGEHTCRTAAGNGQRTAGTFSASHGQNNGLCLNLENSFFFIRSSDHFILCDIQNHGS